MNLFVFIPLLISQINAGPPPKALAKHLRISGLGKVMAELPHVDHFPISRYLRLAEYLQSMPERERITWLRMAGEWRETQFKVLSNEQVAEVAHDYLA